MSVQKAIAARRLLGSVQTRLRPLPVRPCFRLRALMLVPGRRPTQEASLSWPEWLA